MKTNKEKWEEQFEKDYEYRLTFLSERNYYWNRGFYNEVKDFNQKLKKEVRIEIIKKLLEETHLNENAS